MHSYSERYHQFTSKYRWILFPVFIIAFHFFYQYWSSINYLPFSNQMALFFQQEINLLSNESEAWLNFENISYTRENNIFYIPCSNGLLGWLRIDPVCTEVRGWFLWLFLIPLAAGSIKHKLWYLPLGIFIIHIGNMLRIFWLAHILAYKPTSYDYYHNLLSNLVYVIIFLLWIVWNKYLEPDLRNNHSELKAIPLEKKR